MADIALATGTGAGPRPSRRNYDERPKTAHAALTPGNVVYVRSNGRVDKARANAVGTAVAYGIAIVGVGTDGAIAAGERVTILRRGSMTGWVGLTPGQIIYMSSAVAGALADAAPAGGGGNFLVPVGIAETASEIFFDFPRFPTAIA